MSSAWSVRSRSATKIRTCSRPAAQVSVLAVKRTADKISFMMLAVAILFAFEKIHTAASRSCISLFLPISSFL